MKKQTYYLSRSAPHRRYSLSRYALHDAENIPVEGFYAAREKQAELNAGFPKRAFQRPPGSGKKKADDPTYPVTIRVKQSVLDRMPQDASKRNAAIVAVIEKNL